MHLVQAQVRLPPELRRGARFRRGRMRIFSRKLDLRQVNPVVGVHDEPLDHRLLGYRSCPCFGHDASPQVSQNNLYLEKSCEIRPIFYRWHKVLRTPLEVISDSRIHTVNNAFAASAAENERLDGLGGGGGGGGGGVTPGGGPGVPPTSATVSIMVMYRPNKPRGHAQPATVELPPSYESLFMEDAPPSYSLVRSSPNSSTEAEINNPEEATIVVSNSASESQMQEQPLPQQQQQHSIQEVMPSTSTSMASGVVAEALVRHGRDHDHGGVGDDNDDEHCTCDCDHTKCHNAAEAGAAAGVQPAGVDQGAVGPRD